MSPLYAAPALQLHLISCYKACGFTREHLQTHEAKAYDVTLTRNSTGSVKWISPYILHLNSWWYVTDNVIFYSMERCI